MNTSLSSLAVHGIGLVTDTYPDISAFIEKRSEATAEKWSTPFATALHRLCLPDAGTFAQQEALAHLALQAVHQACTMADMLDPAGKLRHPETTGLLFITSWGTIDSTVAYLDSMLEADGRYASPRHFSRSVFSSVAATAAIHFGIHGPCETLCFPRKPVLGALQTAHRLLATKRCDRLIVAWGEQAADIAADLSQIAVTQLHRQEFSRYARQPLGFGTTALVLASPSEPSLATEFARLPLEDVENWNNPHPPFPMDPAIGLIEKILCDARSRV